MRKENHYGSVVATTLEASGAKLPELEIRQDPSGLGYHLGEVGALAEPEFYERINTLLVAAKKEYNVDARHWQFLTPLDNLLANEAFIEEDIIASEKSKRNLYILQGVAIPIILAIVLFLIGVITSMNSEGTKSLAENLFSGRNWVYYGALVALIFGGGEIIFGILFSARKPKHWWQVLGAGFGVFIIFFGLQFWQAENIPNPEKDESKFSIKFNFGKND